MVTKDTPKKRLSVPPNSATKEEMGYISCSVETLVFSDTAQSEKATYSDSKSEGFMSPNKLYFLYLQGLVHLVSLKILSKSDDLILSKILPYSLVRDES